MRRLLVATTCLTPFAFGCLAQPAFAAAVSITGARTADIATSTVDSGAAGDISITSTGSVTPTTAGAAVTIDSANSVTNAGTITITGINNSIGILGNAGETGSITNSGTITVNETYTQTDTNGDGIVDGAFAEGSDRFGIQTAGAFTGDITNSGTITVKGNDSAGISTLGTLTGSLSQTGTITVTGDNSVGISTAAITGDVGIAGTVSATGSGASAVVLNGDIGGALTIQGVLTSTGYTSLTLPTANNTLGADNLLQNGPTLQVAGSVAGGIEITAATSTTDSSGNTVTTTASTITSDGSGAAVQIGSATQDITIGALAGDTKGYGFEMNGTITSLGIYPGFATHGLVIGGLGGDVTIAGGVAINGTISASTNVASATAFEVGSGATVPEIDIVGSVTATGATNAGQTSTGLVIDSGANVQTVTNSGTLSATASGTAADTVAFADKSGTVTQFTNSGSVIATGGASNTALDFSGGSQNVTVTQEASSTDSTTTPSIAGDILFGTGTDALNVSAGTVTGDVTFGGGNDSIALSGSSTLTGNVDFGNATGGTFSVGTGSTFTGDVTNTGGIGISVSGGTLTVSNAATLTASSLSISNGGTLGLSIDGSTGVATEFNVSGAATFGTGSKIALHFNDIANVAGTYSVIQASSITGADNLSIATGSMPYLFTATLAENASDTAVNLTVARKTAAQLGLNRAESAAYEPIIAAISKDTAMGNSFLSYTSGSSLTKALRSMLPDFAGGTFATISTASRDSARWLADPAAPTYQFGPWGVWIQQVGWIQNKSIGESASYHLSGWGLSGGGEYSLGSIGRIGASVSFLAGDNYDKGTPNEITDDQYELGLYWRADWGKLHAFARGSVGTVNFHGHRHFDGDDDGTAFTRDASSKWNGKMISGMGGLSYEFAFGPFSLRPQASIDYYRLHEGSYAETGGGTGFDLLVDSRTSDELGANESVAFGYRILEDKTDDEGTYMRVEVEGGRREVVGGSLGATTASFAGGQDFTLVPDDRKGGWTGALRLKGGNSGFTASGEIDGEHEDYGTAVSLRVGIQMSF